MGYFNGDFNALSYNVKIIGRIPIEFNEKLDEHTKQDCDLYLIEENGKLQLTLEWNKSRINGLLTPDIEEAQEVEEEI